MKECTHRFEHIVRKLVPEPCGEGVQCALRDVLIVVNDAESAAEEGLCLLRHRRLSCAATSSVTCNSVPEVEPPMLLMVTQPGSCGALLPGWLEVKVAHQEEPADRE